MLSRASLNLPRRAVAGCALVALAGLALPAKGQDGLPAVRIVLTLDVHDSAAWLEAYQEILATPVPSPNSRPPITRPRKPLSKSSTSSKPHETRSQS